MVLDAEICRPVADFCIRLVNDFRWKDVLFVKNFCVLVQEFRDDSEPATDGSFHGEGVGSSALAVSSLSSSGMAVVAEEPLRRRRGDPVSAYPLHRFTYNASVRWRRGHQAGVFTHGRQWETLSNSRFGDVRFEFLVLYVLYCAFIKSAADEVLNTRLQIVVQLDIHDLTLKESRTEGTKRAWVIEQTLARVAACGPEQFNIRPKYKGLRRRPARNHAKPWMAEVRNPKTKRIWIGDFSTRQAAALAADVGTVYYGTGKEILNFQHTPRFLPRTLEYSSEKEKREAVRKEARLLRESTLFYLIHQLPYEVVSLEILTSSRIQRRFKLAALVVQLMKLVRMDREEPPITFGLPEPGDIPQLLQSINRLIENNPSQEDVDDGIGNWSFPHILQCYLLCLPPKRGDDIPLTLHFIGWVERNYMRAPETSSWKSSSHTLLDPLLFYASHVHGFIPATRICHHQMPLEIAGCHGQHTTIFPSPIPTAVEVSIFPLPMSNCGFQTGSVGLNEDLQVHNNLTPIQGNSMLRLTSEDLMHGSIETMEWANKGLDTPPVSMGSNWQLTCMPGMSSRLPLPSTCFSPLSIPTQTQAMYMDLDDGEDHTMSCPSWIVVGDAPSECNTMAVPCPCPGEQVPDTLEYDKRHPHETPVELNHAATMLLSSQLAEFMDSNEGEDFTTLLETEKCDQHGCIRDHIFQLEEMLRHDLEVCNLDIDDTVLIAITGPKEANETNSWHIHDSLTEPPQPFVFSSQPFVFSSQPFVQFDEYLY